MEAAGGAEGRLVELPPELLRLILRSCYDPPVDTYDVDLDFRDQLLAVKFYNRTLAACARVNRRLGAVARELIGTHATWEQSGSQALLRREGSLERIESLVVDPTMIQAWTFEARTVGMYKHRFSSLRSCVLSAHHWEELVTGMPPSVERTVADLFNWDIGFGRSDENGEPIKLQPLSQVTSLTLVRSWRSFGPDQDDYFFSTPNLRVLELRSWARTDIAWFLSDFVAPGLAQLRVLHICDMWGDERAGASYAGALVIPQSVQEVHLTFHNARSADLGAPCLINALISNMQSTNSNLRSISFGGDGSHYEGEIAFTGRRTEVPWRLPSFVAACRIAGVRVYHPAVRPYSACPALALTG